MSTLHIEKDSGFTTATDLTMTKNVSTNNAIPVNSKVGYIFDGWNAEIVIIPDVPAQPAKITTFYKSDGTTETSENDSTTITAYNSNGTTRVLENTAYVPGIPGTKEYRKIFDGDGKAVQATDFWSDDYPNGVWLADDDTSLYPIWEEAEFTKQYVKDDGSAEGHLFALVDGELVRADVKEI